MMIYRSRRGTIKNFQQSSELLVLHIIKNKEKFVVLGLQGAREFPEWQMLTSYLLYLYNIRFLYDKPVIKKKISKKEKERKILSIFITINTLTGTA